MLIYDWFGYSDAVLAGGWLYAKFANGFGISSIHTRNRWDYIEKHKYEIAVWIFKDKILDSDHLECKMIKDFYKGNEFEFLKTDMTVNEFNAELIRIESITEEKYNEIRKKYYG